MKKNRGTVNLLSTRGKISMTKRDPGFGEFVPYFYKNKSSL